MEPRDCPVLQIGRELLMPTTGSCFSQYRKWRFYAESLIEQAISILMPSMGMRILKTAGMGNLPSLPLSVVTVSCAGVPAAMTTGSSPYRSQPELTNSL